MAKIERFPNVPWSERRGVVLLIAHSDQFVNVQDVFQSLDDSSRRQLQRFVDYWVKGHGKPKQHHGWDKSEYGGRYIRCYVFKPSDYRFYGYLTNPRARDRRFQICVLIHAVTKNKWRTNETVLKNIVTIGEDSQTRQAITDYFSGEDE